MVCRPSEVSENLFSFHAKRKALPSLGLLGQRVNIQCWRYNGVDTSSTCPHVAFNQGVHAWMSSIAQSRAAVTSGEKLPSLRVFSYSLCVYERRSREVRAATRWARPQLRTSTSSCPGVYWHSEHETTAGSVTDDWHRRVIEKTCFLTVSSQGKQWYTTPSSLTPRTEVTKASRRCRTWSCFVFVLVGLRHVRSVISLLQIRLYQAKCHFKKNDMKIY